VEAVAWSAHWEESTPEHLFGIWKEGRLWSVLGREFPDEAAANQAPLPEPLRQLTEGRVDFDAPPQVLSLSAEGDTRQRAPTHRRVWCDYCFDLEGLRRFAQFVDGERSLWTRGLNTVYLLALANPAERTRWPFDMRSGTHSPGRLYAFGLYYGVRAEDREGLAAAEAAHRMCLEWSLRNGGRPYLYGRNLLGPDSLEALYGEDLARLRTLKHSLDPKRLLNPHGLGDV
jgi:FAD/FMN-containing dehydrogenase